MGRKGPFGGAATQPTPPPPLSPPTAPPLRPRVRARLHLPRAQSTRSFSNKTTLRTASRTRRGETTPSRQPAGPGPGARAFPRPLPAADGRRARLHAVGRETGPGSAAQLCPAPPLHPRAARSDRRGTYGARAARVNRFAAGPAPREGGDPGTHRNEHPQRSPLLAGVFLAAAPARAGNIFLLLGVHGRASHNFNQKLIPGDSFLEDGPLLPSPAPAVGLEPRARPCCPAP